MRKFLLIFLVIFITLPLFAFTTYSDSLYLQGVVSEISSGKIFYGKTNSFFDSIEVLESVSLTEGSPQFFSLVFFTNQEFLNVIFSIDAQPLVNQKDFVSTLDYTVTSETASSPWSISSTEGMLSNLNFDVILVDSESLTKTFSSQFKVTLLPIPQDATIGNYSGSISIEIIAN